MSARWLTIIGIGEDGLEALSPAARTLIDGADLIIGGERHLAMLPDHDCERMSWPSPLSELVDRIPDFLGRNVVVLATGDPMSFGIGSALVKHVPADEITILPAQSAFSLAASRMAWPLDTCAQITLHGRPHGTLALHVHPNARLLILSHDASTPRVVAEWLTAHGFGDSRMTALAHMAGDKETRHESAAAGWSHDVADFNTIAVECIADTGAVWFPRIAGLPDEAFRHDGKMTKREARALALAKLRPHTGALLWDIGAGCGSIAVEWLRAAPGTNAIALEPKADRRAMAAHNAIRLGVPQLEIRDALAPDGLGDLPQPDAIFVGGGISDETLSAAIRSLPAGGRLVAHAVTLESEAVLLAHHGRLGGELIRLSAARAEPVGPWHGWRPAMPVTQWALDKTGAMK